MCGIQCGALNHLVSHRELLSPASSGPLQLHTIPPLQHAALIVSPAIHNCAKILRPKYWLHTSFFPFIQHNEPFYIYINTTLLRIRLCVIVCVFTFVWSTYFYYKLYLYLHLHWHWQPPSWPGWGDSSHHTTSWARSFVSPTTSQHSITSFHSPVVLVFLFVFLQILFWYMTGAKGKIICISLFCQAVIANDSLASLSEKQPQFTFVHIVGFACMRWRLLSQLNLINRHRCDRERYS